MEEIVKLIKNGVVQYPITTPEAVIDKSGVTLDQKIKDIVASTDILRENIIELTHFELLQMHYKRELVPEQQYRIIDYHASFTFYNGTSAGHQFDIIVRAKNEGELYREAGAARHEGDTYFANSNLNEWKLWYEIDEDPVESETFLDMYASTQGVILRMIDEFGNDAPYDFKNAKFNRIGEKFFGGVHTFSARNAIDDHSLTGKVTNMVLVSCANVFYGDCANSTFILSNGNFFFLGAFESTFINSKYNTINSYCVSSTFKECSSNVLGERVESSYLSNCSNNNIPHSIMYSTVTNVACTSPGNANSIPSLQNTTYLTDMHTFTSASGAILPLKHPDLSTQPSVLPYMCMGNNVFEYLIPYNNVNTLECALEYEKPLILSCDIIGVGIKINCNVIGYVDNILTIEPSKEITSDDPLFIKINYTTLEKRNSCDGGDYGDYGDYSNTYSI